MKKYRDMVDAVDVVPNLIDVDCFTIGSAWFCVLDKQGKYHQLIKVANIKNKTDAFDHLVHYSMERMKKEQADIFKVTP